MRIPSRSFALATLLAVGACAHSAELAQTQAEPIPEAACARYLATASPTAMAVPLHVTKKGHSAMSKEQERNLAVVCAYMDALNRHDLDAAAALSAVDARNHGKPAGRAGVRMVLDDMITRAPDVHFDNKEIVAVDDQVILRTDYQGTHLGVGRLPVDGGQLIGVPPTGKKFSVQHIHWFTLKDGLIVDHRANRDDVSMLVQLGLLPAPPPFPIPPRAAAGTP